jgi:hypothetical protein
VGTLDTGRIKAGERAATSADTHGQRGGWSEAGDGERAGRERAVTRRRRDRFVAAMCSSVAVSTTQVRY